MDSYVLVIENQELRRENEKLRSAIMNHRSQKADDRCIEDDDILYSVLEDGIKCDRRVGNKEEMLKNCQRFIENRCENGKWKTYQELEQELKTCIELLDDTKDYLWHLRNCTRTSVLINKIKKIIDKHNDEQE